MRAVAPAGADERQQLRHLFIARHGRERRHADGSLPTAAGRALPASVQRRDQNRAMQCASASRSFPSVLAGLRLYQDHAASHHVGGKFDADASPRLCGHADPISVELPRLRAQVLLIGVSPASERCAADTQAIGGRSPLVPMGLWSQSHTAAPVLSVYGFRERHVLTLSYKIVNTPDNWRSR